MVEEVVRGEKRAEEEREGKLNPTLCFSPRLGLIDGHDVCCTKSHTEFAEDKRGSDVAEGIGGFRL